MQNTGPEDSEIRLASKEDTSSERDRLLDKEVNYVCGRRMEHTLHVELLKS